MVHVFTLVASIVLARRAHTGCCAVSGRARCGARVVLVLALLVSIVLTMLWAVNTAVTSLLPGANAAFDHACHHHNGTGTAMQVCDTR